MQKALIEGFAAAPSLQSFLKRFLLDFAKNPNLSYEVDLVTANE